MKYLLIFFLSANLFSSLLAEKIITSKTDLPDSYYGLKLGAVVTPSFGYRIRDSASGVSNASPNDRTGFASPWTLIMLSKEWEEKGLSMEVWGELTRNSNLTMDTKVNDGTKNNPYVLQIRRANLQKSFSIGNLESKIIFGIQELPHVYTQWNQNWKWRYIDRAPAESLGFAAFPSDLGISGTLKYSIIEFYMGIMNGEGYREIQNTESSAFDVYSRISVENEIEKHKFGIHFINRFANVFGAGGSECREGKTGCLSSDENLNSLLEKDIRSLKSETAGLEINYEWDSIINLGMGGIAKKQYGGMTRDILNPGTSVSYSKDSYGNAIYSWISFHFSDFTIGFRWEKGTGKNGTLNTGFSTSPFPENVFTAIPPGIANPSLSFSNPSYSSKESFIRRSLFLEYKYDSSIRFAIGGIEVKNFDNRGYPQNIYTDYLGQERTQAEYLQQWINGPVIISSYADRRDRNLFLRATFEF